MNPGLPVWRSLLYVPVNVDKYVDKAHTRGADCIQVDLERYCHVHERILPLFLSFFLTVATSLSFCNPQHPIVGGTISK